MNIARVEKHIKKLIKKDIERLEQEIQALDLKIKRNDNATSNYFYAIEQLKNGHLSPEKAMKIAENAQKEIKRALKYSKGGGYANDYGKLSNLRFLVRDLKDYIQLRLT